MAYDENGQWIPELPQQLPGMQASGIIGGMSEEERLRAELQRLLEPEFQRVTAGPEAGAYAGSFGPSRESSISPENLAAAAEIMSLLDMRANQETEVERNRMAQDVLRPSGGGSMTMGEETRTIEPGGPMTERDKWALSGAVPPMRNPDAGTYGRGGGQMDFSAFGPYKDRAESLQKALDDIEDEEFSYDQKLAQLTPKAGGEMGAAKTFTADQDALRAAINKRRQENAIRKQQIEDQLIQIAQAVGVGGPPQQGSAAPAQSYVPPGQRQP